MKRLTRYKQKVVLAAMLEGKSMPSKIDYEQSLFFSWSVEQIARDTPLPPTWRPIKIILVWKNQKIYLLNMLPLKFPLQDNFLCALSIFVINRIPSHFLKEALVT